MMDTISALRTMVEFSAQCPLDEEEKEVDEGELDPYYYHHISNIHAYGRVLLNHHHFPKLEWRRSGLVGETSIMRLVRLRRTHEHHKTIVIYIGPMCS
jgi:hypothetical protein